MLGPTMRAKVGDTIKITFKNNCKFTTSLHPHGVFYDKGSEGSPYADGTSPGKSKYHAQAVPGSQSNLNMRAFASCVGLSPRHIIIVYLSAAYLIG